MYLCGDGAQAVRTVIHRVHRSHDGEQCLCGADIRGGLLAADMLLTCLQRHAQRGVAIGIHRHADDATRHRTLVCVAAGEERGVRAAVAHWHAEALGGAQHHISAPFAGRCEQHQAQDVGRDGDGHAICFSTLHEIGVVMHHAVSGGILQQCAIQLVVQGDGLEVTDDQFDAERLGACLQQFDGLRETFVRDEEAVLTCRHVIARTQTVQHRHRFCSGSRFIQQRSVGDLHAREVTHHGLEIQQRFQTTLCDLSLIRRVSGVPAGIFQHVALDDRWHDGVVVTQPDVTLEQLVLRRDVAQMLQERVLAHAVRQAQRLLQADGGGNGLVYQRIK